MLIVPLDYAAKGPASQRPLRLWLAGLIIGTLLLTLAHSWLSTAVFCGNPTCRQHASLQRSIDGYLDVIPYSKTALLLAPITASIIMVAFNYRPNRSRIDRSLLLCFIAVAVLHLANPIRHWVTLSCMPY